MNNNELNTFSDLLRTFDLNYFGTGKHKISFEKMMELRNEDKVFILDVRTKEEIDMVEFKFAVHIPTNEIPDRLAEIPKDKTIAIFCVSGTRATMVSMYLQVNGYANVKILPNSHSELTGFFKPGYILKQQNEVK